MKVGDSIRYLENGRVYTGKVFGLSSDGLSVRLQLDRRICPTPLAWLGNVFALDNVTGLLDRLCQMREVLTCEIAKLEECLAADSAKSEIES